MSRWSEFVLLAALTALQWVRHRIRGAGLGRAVVRHSRWPVAGPEDRSRAGHDQHVAKLLIALLLVMPYCLFRFAATFRAPGRAVRVPRHRRSRSASWSSPSRCSTCRHRAPPHRRTSWPTGSRSWSPSGSSAATWSLSLLLAGRGEPPIAASRMHLLAVAVAGLEIQVAGGRARAPGADRRPAHAGAHRGDGRPVPGGAGAALLRTRLPEPQGGRGLPAGRRRARVRR